MRRKLLSVPEAATCIGHSPGTLRNRSSRGRLPLRYGKSGRKVLTDMRELEEWIDRLPLFGGTQGQEG